MKTKIEAALARDVDSPHGWLSDAQNAQLEYDEFNSSIRFCGEGSIDLSHMIEIVLSAAKKVPGE